MSHEQSSVDWVEKLSRRFNNLLQEIELGLEVEEVLNHPDGCVAFENMHSQILELKQIIVSMKSNVNQGKKEVETMKENLASLNQYQQRIDRALLFSFKTAIPGANTKESGSTTATALSEVSNKENIQISGIKKMKSYPQLNMIKEEDYSKVPRHVRGHMTIEQMNEGIVEVNLILQQKYEFLSRPRKTLTLQEEKRRAAYLEQAKEVKGTPNAVFFVDSDIQRYGKMLKLKRKTRDSIFLVLRHVRCIKESHKGKVTRYTVLKL